MKHQTPTRYTENRTNCMTRWACLHLPNSTYCDQHMYSVGGEAHIAVAVAVAVLAVAAAVLLLCER